MRSRLSMKLSNDGVKVMKTERWFGNDKDTDEISACSDDVLRGKILRQGRVNTCYFRLQNVTRVSRVVCGGFIMDFKSGVFVWALGASL
ncbi:hypothetical protein Bca4012_059901 [Brassica carinata]